MAIGANVPFESLIIQSIEIASIYDADDCNAVYVCAYEIFKIDDYLIVATSSEGTVRNGPGDTIKMELMNILKGKYYNPHVSIWWYKLDDIKEVADPAMWVKANPNIAT